MAYPSSGLTAAVIDQWKAKGYNQTQIAEMFGVSRQAVSKVKAQAAHTRTPREEVAEHFPWVIPRALEAASPGRRIRDHAEFMATGGRGMSQDKLERLRWFYEKLDSEDLVVEFDPEIPPSPGIKTGGFAFRERMPDDGDLIIRANEYTRLTDEGRKLWRFPPRRP